MVYNLVCQYLPHLDVMYWGYLLKFPNSLFLKMLFLFPVQENNRIIRCFILIYRIRPSYRTVRLGFSKLLGKLVVKYDSVY